jgi:hypothetical protein
VDGGGEVGSRRRSPSVTHSSMTSLQKVRVGVQGVRGGGQQVDGGGEVGSRRRSPSVTHSSMTSLQKGC